MAGALLAACQRSDKTSGLMTVDLNLYYPEKELVLQDFMDVEYLPLETNDEFITSGILKAMGEKYLVIVSDRKLFLFDRHTGKGIKVIDRVGQGPEEYTMAYNVVLDEAENELFVNDPLIGRICVYDLQGNFKRSFNHGEGYKFVDVTGFDKDYLICFNENIFMDAENAETDSSKSYHFLISKKDGSVVQEIHVPYEKLNVPMIQAGGITSIAFVKTIMPLHDDALIIQNSSDTVYRFTAQKHQLVPYLVKVPSTDPERMITIGTETSRYCFLQTIDKTFNPQTGRGFPLRELVYDKQTDEIFSSVVLNADFASRQQVDMIRFAQNRTVSCVQTLEAQKLMDALEKGELKGRLKKIASTLTEDSNPVMAIMTEK